MTNVEAVEVAKNTRRRSQQSVKMGRTKYRQRGLELQEQDERRSDVKGSCNERQSNVRKLNGGFSNDASLA